MSNTSIQRYHFYHFAPFFFCLFPSWSFPDFTSHYFLLIIDFLRGNIMCMLTFISWCLWGMRSLSLGWVFSFFSLIFLISLIWRWCFIAFRRVSIQSVFNFLMTEFFSYHFVFTRTLLTFCGLWNWRWFSLSYLFFLMIN
jgi:hypothetical protein